MDGLCRVPYYSASAVHAILPVPGAPMPKRDLTGQRLVALSAFGWLLLAGPLVPLFDLPARRVLGVPLLPAYLFGVWTLLIVLIAWVAERAPRR